ncbi:MAG: fimbrillin family protein, partial [Bacteroidales bacterium]|nr:fimbrillin family protein [Bacteroidales bacterium]
VAKDVTPETTVALAFKHPFAKITVTVDNQLEGTPEVSAPVFDGLVISGTIDLAEDKVVLGPDKTSVTTIAQESGAFEAIILPQSAKPVLSVTAGEKTFVFALPAAVNFEANKAYTVNLTLTDSTPVIEDGEEVAFTFTVADWESAGEALAYEDVTDALYVSGTIYQGTKPETAWAEDYQMTKGEDGKYSITVTYDESLAGEDDSARGFLVFKVNWTAKWGLWSEGEQMNIAYDYGTLANGYNIRLATVAEEVWTPVAGEVTITFNPADNKLVVTTE